MKKLLMIVMALAAGLSAWGDEAAFARFAVRGCGRWDGRAGIRLLRPAANGCEAGEEYGRCERGWRVPGYRYLRGAWYGDGADAGSGGSLGERACGGGAGRGDRGAEAITWACWCAGWWTNNVIDKAGRPTPQYAKLQTMNAELKRLGPAYMKYRSVETYFVGFPENSPRNPLQPCPKVAQLTAGGVKGLHAADGSALLVGVMEPRLASAKGARAFFVTAAGDPRDDKPGTVEICFVPAPKAKVSVQGGQGPIPVKRLEKGVYAFSLPSCAGAFVEIR